MQRLRVGGRTGFGMSVVVTLLCAVSWLVPVRAQVTEEIIVTTRKTAEDIQDVPIAITAAGAEEIQRLGIRGLNDVVDLDTSVRIQNTNFFGGGGSITMRGLAPIVGRPNVATLIDGIDITGEGLSLDGGGILIDPRMIDVERIEIAKGPQNVLYGRTAFAGAIHYVTKDPTETFHAEVNADIAEHGNEAVRGSVSGPINDALGYRINGLWYDEDGYYRNSMTGAKIGGAEGWGAAITLKWQPRDSLSLKWRTDYADDEFAIPAQAALPINTVTEVDALASECNTTPAGNPGPVPDKNCDLGRAPEVVSNYFANPNLPQQDPNTGYTSLGLGTYDPVSNPSDADQFHDMTWRSFMGEVPDLSEIEAITGYPDGIAISPNYQFGPGAIDPLAAIDYPGNARDVLRSTLIADWQFADNWALTSWTAWTNADSSTAQDGDKVAIPGLLDPADPSSLVDNTFTTLNIWQELETDLFSQELRFAWNAGEKVDVTLGGLFWHEKVEQFDRSSPLIVGGVQCFILPDGTVDMSFDPGGQFFFSLNPLQHECGRTNDFARNWAAEAFEENPGYLSSRETDHFSVYGSVDYDFSERWGLRAEARWSREKTETSGPRMEPCWEGLTRGEATSAGCLEPYDVIIGPGTIVACGQTGRCDTADQSNTVPGFANNDWGWWPYNFTPIPARTETFKKTDSWITPKVTLTFRPADAMMIYGSWGIAKKPGGFSLLTSGTFGIDPNLDGIPDEIDFDSEEMTVWELGGKTAWLDGRLFVNGALFFQDFTDKQDRVTENIGGTTGPVIRNVAGAEIWGLEIDASWAVTDRWTIAGALTLLDSEYTDYTTKTNSAAEIASLGCLELTDIEDKVTGAPVEEGGACWVSRNGNEVERAPPVAALVLAKYTAPLLQTNIDWYAEWRTRYEDEQFGNSENDLIVQSRSITDLRLGLQAERWNLQLYVKNLFDDDTIPSAGQTGPDLPNSEFRIGLVGVIPPPTLGNPKIPPLSFANLPPPRQIGMQFGYSFGE